MDSIKFYVAALLILGILDLIWFKVLTPDFYNTQIGEIARRSGNALNLNWPSAILVYLLLSAGLTVFVLTKTINVPLSFYTFMQGALFGLVVYGIYDWTNYAVLAYWPLKLAIVDNVWGMLTCGITTFIATWIVQR